MKTIFLIFIQVFIAYCRIMPSRKIFYYEHEIIHKEHTGNVNLVPTYIYLVLFIQAVISL